MQYSVRCKNMFLIDTIIAVQLSLTYRNSDRLRKNKPITTTTLNDLCRILHCGTENILEYIPSAEDQAL